MSEAYQPFGEPIYDLVGVGFGPSNLALAIAVTEHGDVAGAARAARAVFLERQPRFGWHTGMLFEDATMQVSFMKDLVTLRNPASRFSFLCYLHSKDRLVDFINHKSLFPTRVEFHDYLEWAAAKVAGLVRYDHGVIDVAPVERDGAVDHFNVIAQGPRAARVYSARNVVFATGLAPSMPDGLVPSTRIWHNSDLLHRVETVEWTAAPRRFVVLGAGQSAAEVTAFLHGRFPAASVHAVFARYGYSPADDSPFANRIFDPAAVGDFHAAPAEVKQMMLDYHNNTNYSVVDGELIEELYRRVYREKVTGTQRLMVHNVSRLVLAAETAGGVRVTIESLASGHRTDLDADVLVCATGYRPADPSGLLTAVWDDCLRDEYGRVRVSRDYRVLTRTDAACGIYLQGGTEHSHGITSSLLSNTSVRAGEILESILARRDADAAVPPPRDLAAATPNSR
jgi:L-ornithine N5-oxygenase